MTLKPLVSIIGTTGVGKSRLGIELALALSLRNVKHDWHGAKVINADSMQVYAGADVITNKVPESERRGVEHLLMGFKDPGEQYVVGKWVNDAVREIDTLHRQNAVPLVVGGTSYWMQHLMFPNRLTSFDDPHLNETEPRPSSTPSPALQKSISSLPGPLLELFLHLPEKPDAGQAFALHQILTVLDPRMASRWHWNDTRKVRRNLEIIKERGVPASEVMDQQAQSVEAPRYRTLILWLFSEPNILRPRLDKRVDEMMQQGLLDDVRMLRQIASTNASASESDVIPIDTTSSIFQSIGVKEFDSYLSSPTPSQDLYALCVERTKTSTRQYARRQLQWIQNKLLPAVNVANKSGVETPVYLLNVTDLEKWDTEVRDTAVNLLHDFLAERDLPDPCTLSEAAKTMLDVQTELEDPTAVLTARRKVVCELCTADTQQPIMVDDGAGWQEHLRSRKHRRRQREEARKLGTEKRVEERRRAAEKPAQGLALVDDLNFDSTTSLLDA